MSRIGKKPIAVPKDVQVEVNDKQLTATGPKGKLIVEFPLTISGKIDKDQIFISRANDSKPSKSLHGLIRSLASNIITGVGKGFSKQLEVIGVGFRVQVQGSTLSLQLGYSHPIDFAIPADIKITTKQNQITIEGIDKARVGQIAATIRDFYPPEPYKGKGIRYVGEKVRKKVGKVVSK